MTPGLSRTHEGSPARLALIREAGCLVLVVAAQEGSHPGRALDAAAAVHTDLARGFIRAEVIADDDLIRAGSEREAKARHLARAEPKDYVVKDEDVLLTRFSV